MQKTSALYKKLLQAPHKTETRLTIGESGRLMNESGSVIKFGGVSILVADSGPDSGYDEHSLISVKTETMVFENEPTAGNAIAGMIDVRMLKPVSEIPRQARISPYVRLTDLTGEIHSEWLKKGVFFIDTRDEDADRSGIEQLVIQGFDAMLRAEAPYPSSSLQWPALDVDVVKEIAGAMGVSVDPRTWDNMNHGYLIAFPADYSQREVLSFIAAMYGGNFFMTDSGELLMALIAGIPKETRYLVTDDGFSLVVGGDRILV